MSGYQKNVFINCPFDKEYLSLLHPLLFTIIRIGFNPRLALERLDSGEPRFSKICKLISQCKYGIHDLSRIKASRSGEYYRLNMPFELGLDVGARVFNRRKHRLKRCLILEKERYRFQVAISDLSNSDIKRHNDKAVNVVTATRNWFAENGLRRIPSASSIWYSFNDFTTDFEEKRSKEGFSKRDLYDMPITEIMWHMKAWNQKNGH